MSQEFREFLRKVGSGPHTSKDLTREESAIATRLMLQQIATPVQIGAFMIAHRIKRPTGAELAGMLDAYDELGPKVAAIESQHPVLVLNTPYDGRDRTLPLSVITSLILAVAGCPVLQHGGDRMPTKEGVPLVELWQGLGIDWTKLSLQAVHHVLQATGIAYVYLPTHFPQAHALVPFRRDIGKRPPFATLELIWSPYAGDAHVVVGFVHPPTENMARTAYALRGTTRFTTVKGLEGSCDLPRERTAIIGMSGDVPTHAAIADASADLSGDIIPAQSETPPVSLAPFQRLTLHCQDYGFASKNVPWVDGVEAIAAMKDVLQGKSTELRQSVLWNSGFYLWRTGICGDLEGAIAQAASILDSGQAQKKLKELYDCYPVST